VLLGNAKLMRDRGIAIDLLTADWERLAGEGKTLTAANLALTFSESYQKRVLLIDADLRRPSLHSVFRIETASGLTEGLADPKATLVVRHPRVEADDAHMYVLRHDETTGVWESAALTRAAG